MRHVSCCIVVLSPIKDGLQQQRVGCDGRLVQGTIGRWLRSNGTFARFSRLFFWTVSRGNRGVCIGVVLLLDFLEEEFFFLGHSCGECFLRGGPALVACKQGPVAFVEKPIKHKSSLLSSIF